MSVNVKPYVPEFYEGCLDFEILTDAENWLLNAADTEVIDAQNNQYILTANAVGLTAFERIFDIRASPTDTIEFRRQRLLNRLSMTPPFTLRFLRKKLDSLLGVGNYSVYVDYANRTLYVETVSSDQSWYQELWITINTIRPANMGYINKPLLSETVLASETVSTFVKHYNYALGHWQLGQKPFATIDPEEVIKLPSVQSINNNLLTDVAAFSASDIVAVRLNGAVKITEFTTKTGQGTTALIEYSVTPTQAKEITQIELLGTGDRVLTSSAVYIPVIEVVACKHTINFVEGVLPDGN